MKRPKSAVIMSMPYNFPSKQEAIAAKRKALDLFSESIEDFLTTKRSCTNQTFGSSMPSYCDSGPSLFYSVSRKYSQKTSKRENRLKPCKKINSRSIETIRKLMSETRTQTQLMNMVLNNNPKNLQTKSIMKNLELKSLKLKKRTYKKSAGDANFIDKLKIQFKENSRSRLK